MRASTSVITRVCTCILHSGRWNGVHRYDESNMSANPSGLRRSTMRLQLAVGGGVSWALWLATHSAHGGCLEILSKSVRGRRVRVLGTWSNNTGLTLH